MPIPNFYSNNLLIYFDKTSLRLVRAITNIDINFLPTGLKNYQTKFVTVFSEEFFNDVLLHPYNYIFHNVHGLIHNENKDILIEEFKLNNIRLELIEILWKLANNFLKNTAIEYMYNNEIRKVLEFEKENDKFLDEDSLTNFLRKNDTELDTKVYNRLSSLHLNFFYEKRKDILKTILIVQEKIITSKSPVQDFWNELRTIYLKY